MGYPAALFNDMLSYSRAPAVKRALEIGCGTGQATMSLAEQDIALTCIEPGAQLAELARRNLSGFSNVEIVCTRFEDWNPGHELFDLVIAANSIHWVKRRVRVRKTAQVLRPGGTLALFRSFPIGNGVALESSPESATGAAPIINEEPQRLPKENEFRASGCFESFEEFRYESRQEYSADAYVKLLSTLNRYKTIEPVARNALFEKIRETILRHGGTVTLGYVTRLVLARRCSRRSWLSKFYTASFQRQ
jgi:SAM-dependent methyltransferase